MLYFDNINFLNLEYIFNLVFKIPEFLLNVFLYSAGLFIGFSFELKLLLTVVTATFAAVLFYALFRIWELSWKDEQNFVNSFVYPPKNEEEEIKLAVNIKWKEILEHLEDENVSSWTMAIIESDKILDGLLTERGYHGAGVGERLKMIPTGGLRNLNNAWEAHKIRNRIAHEPGFVLNQRDARKAINYYESVFRELGYVD